MFNLIGEVLSFCYDFWPSYGMAVAGLTLVVMVVVTPLTLKGTKSMLQMQRYQPELKAIQSRNRGDRQKMNEEMMAFQQEHGISMFGGCLPLLVQMPLFLVLFRVVQGLTSRATNFGNQFGWTSGRISSGLGLDSTAFASRDRPFLPQNLPVDSDLYLRLAGGDGVSFEERPTEMVSWGMDLSRSAQDVLGESLISGLPYVLMILIVLVSSIFQQRQIQGRHASAMPPQQQMLMKILPYMLPVFSFTMPAALVVYFVVSNLYRIGQQAYITRSLYRGEDSPGALLAKKREEMGNADDVDHAASGGRTTPKKGTPTPKSAMAVMLAKRARNQRLDGMHRINRAAKRIVVNQHQLARDLGIRLQTSQQQAVRNRNAQVQVGQAMPRLGTMEGLVERPNQVLHNTRSERTSGQLPQWRDSSWVWQRNSERSSDGMGREHRRINRTSKRTCLRSARRS